MDPFVFHHPNIYIKFVTSFNLAAFFFLSGMFASSENNIFKFAKGCIALLVPFLVVGGIWTSCVRELPLTTLFTNHMHNGYWFLWTLLALRLIFFLRNAIVRRIPHPPITPIVTDAVFLMVIIITSVLLGRVLSPQICSLFSLEMLHSFPIFYFLGVWYKEYVLRKGCNIPKIVIECLLLFFLSSFIIESYLPTEWLNSLLRCARAICGTMVIVHFFQLLPVKFAGSNWLQFVGQHTLEIYVGHYFLLPTGIAVSLMPTVMLGDGIAILLYCLIAMVIIAFMSLLLYFSNHFTLLSFLLFGKIKS